MRVKCGWCREDIQISVTKCRTGERSKPICSNCGQLLPSSKKEMTGELAGRKHIHVEWKEGDLIQ